VGAALAEGIAARPGGDQVTVLGHLQRGGQPTAGDRLVASAFGVYAVDLVAAGRLTGWWLGRTSRRRCTLAVAIAMPHCVDPDGALVRPRAGWEFASAMPDADERPDACAVSLAFYALPGVARALIALQDREGSTSI